MKWITRRAMLLNGVAFAPADEGSGGAGGDGDGGSGDGDGKGGDGSGDGDGDGGDGKGGGSSILDLAKKGGDDDGEGGYKAPDFIPEHLRGKDGDETLSKLHAAYKGARDKIGKGELEGDVPEAADGYKFTDNSKDDTPDKVFAELSSEASKPFIALAQAAAHKVGLPQSVYEGFMREFVSTAEANGTPIGVTDSEAVDISAEAEMEELTRMLGSGAAASTVVNTVESFANKMVDNGILSQADMAEFRIMTGTAESANIFHRILTDFMGEKPIPLADGGDGKVTSTDAYALHAQASAMAPGAERDAAMAEADKAMQNAFGQNPTGSVRSSVL